MTKIFLLASALTGLAFAPALAQSDVEARVAQFIDRLDTDNSGGVSQAEFTAATDELFKASDANGDGYITSAEFRARTGESVDDEARLRAFQKLDLDGDGKISRVEIDTQQTTRFINADVNNDGELDAEELARSPTGN